MYVSAVNAFMQRYFLSLVRSIEENVALACHLNTRALCCLSESQRVFLRPLCAFTMREVKDRLLLGPDYHMVLELL